MNRSSSLAVGLAFFLVGCNGSPKPLPPTLAIRPDVPLSVRLSEAPTRVFTAEEEIPTTFSTFDGARGSVRVSLEIEGPTNPAKSAPLSINDVVFKAVGDGRIALAIKRPWPDHPNGRVTISCQSSGEESSADFEPELWFARPGAIITFESFGGDGATPVAEGKEVVLGRYVARNLPHDIRISLKAMFSKDPVPARTSAGIKPSR